MTNADDRMIRDARAAIVQAIADLRAADIAVPMALHLAAHVLASRAGDTKTPTKSVTPVCNGNGHAGAI